MLVMWRPLAGACLLWAVLVHADRADLDLDAADGAEGASEQGSAASTTPAASGAHEAAEDAEESSSSSYWPFGSSSSAANAAKEVTDEYAPEHEKRAAKGIWSWFGFGGKKEKKRPKKTSQRKATIQRGNYWGDEGFPVQFYYNCVARNYSVNKKGANMDTFDKATCYDWRNREARYPGVPTVNLLDPLLAPICQTNSTATQKERANAILNACASVEQAMDGSDRAIRKDMFKQVFSTIYEDKIGKVKPHERPGVIVVMGPAVDPNFMVLKMGREFKQLSPALWADRHLEFSDFVDDWLAQALLLDGRFMREFRFLHEVARNWRSLHQALPNAVRYKEVGAKVLTGGEKALDQLSAVIFGDGTEESWRACDVHRILKEMHLREAVNAATMALLARNYSFVYKTDMADNIFQVELPKFREAGYFIEGYIPMVPRHEIVRWAKKRAIKTGHRVGEVWIKERERRAQNKLVELLGDFKSGKAPTVFDGLTMITRFSSDGSIQEGTEGYVAMQWDGVRRCLVRCGNPDIFRHFDFVQAAGCGDLPKCPAGDDS